MEQAEQHNQAGVLSQKIENNHYVLKVCRKDGKISTTSFPVNGFEIVNPITKTKLGTISGEQAIETLKSESPNCNFGEFDWKSL